MGRKVKVKLARRGEWARHWNRRERKGWQKGDVCTITDGTNELFGPYSVDDVGRWEVVLDIGALSAPDAEETLEEMEEVGAYYLKPGNSLRGYLYINPATFELVGMAE